MMLVNGRVSNVRPRRSRFEQVRFSVAMALFARLRARGNVVVASRIVSPSRPESRSPVWGKATFKCRTERGSPAGWWPPGG
jgi:hypothetical protein